MRSCELSLGAVGVAERASPGGVPRAAVRGVWVQALSLPRLPVLWAGCRGLLPTCCGRGCAGVGAEHCPVGFHALWGAACRGVGGGPSPGGQPSTVVRGACFQVLSLHRPLLLWGGRPGFHDPCIPGAAAVGVGAQHRPYSVRRCGPSLRAVGVPGGQPRGGCFSPL